MLRRGDIENYAITDPFTQEIIHKSEYSLSQINDSSSVRILEIIILEWK